MILRGLEQTFFDEPKLPQVGSQLVGPGRVPQAPVARLHPFQAFGRRFHEGSMHGCKRASGFSSSTDQFLSRTSGRTRHGALRNSSVAPNIGLFHLHTFLIYLVMAT